MGRADVTLPTDNKMLVLCGGLQSGGTTLVSYCFMQRGDTHGVLDSEYDLLPALDPQLSRPIAWYKTTICCFRLSEIAQYYRDAGWQVRPLLVIRDLRAVWASLRNKAYGRNGITAEDPPLRMRIRRFVEEWRTSEETGTAAFRYEDFIAAPAATLDAACRQLDLPWDDAMLTWPKPAIQIANREGGNETFWSSLGNGLVGTIARYKASAAEPRLSPTDLEWLEGEFREFNVACGYPLHWPDANKPGFATDSGLSGPCFEVTRRYEWETKRKPLRWLLAQFGRRNRKLIDERSWKRAA
jgi:hypothetical protein